MILSETVRTFVDTVESLLGILNEQLYKKVVKELEDNYSVYNLQHNRNDILLMLQTYRLVKECECKTPQNLPQFHEEIKKLIGDLDPLDINEYLLNLPLDRYPVLPKDHINTILEAYEKVKPYYTHHQPRKVDIWYQLVLNFYSDWKNLLSIKDDSIAQEHWLNEMLILVEIEENTQARNTILNVLQRNYPPLEEYLEKFNFK